jgi:hypothetical protein
MTPTKKQREVVELFHLQICYKNKSKRMEIAPCVLDVAEKAEILLGELILRAMKELKS